MAYQIVQYPKRIETAENFKPVIGSLWLDRNGDRWSAVEFPPGTYTYGTVLADMSSGDLLSGDQGTVTTAGSVGDEFLTDSGEFNGDDFRGALGTIVAGTGYGQNFQVTRMIDANQIAIKNLNPNRTPGNNGFTTALGTDSQYRLTIPGRVKTATALDHVVRGVVQVPTFTVPAGEFRYGYVRQTGVGEGRVSSSQGVVQNHGVVTFGSGGELIAAGNTLTINNLFGSVGRVVLAAGADTPAQANDRHYLVAFNISNYRRSFRTGRKAIAPTRSVE